jgi:hypothetical protein
MPSAVLRRHYVRENASVCGRFISNVSEVVCILAVYSRFFSLESIRTGGKSVERIGFTGNTLAGLVACSPRGPAFHRFGAVNLPNARAF